MAYPAHQHRQRPEGERIRERVFAAFSEAELAAWFADMPLFAEYVHRLEEFDRLRRAHRATYIEAYPEGAVRDNILRLISLDDDAEVPARSSGPARLAYLASDVEGLSSIVRGFDVVASGLLRVALWFDGVIDHRTRAHGLIPRATAAEIDRAADDLSRGLCAVVSKAEPGTTGSGTTGTRGGPWLRLLPDVAERIGAPGVSLRRLGSYTSDELAGMLVAHGEKKPAIKADRLDRLTGLLGSRASIERAVASVPLTAQNVFWRLLANVQPMHTDELGVRYFDGFRSTHWSHRTNPSELESLARLGLVDGEDNYAWTWREVIQLFPERITEFEFMARGPRRDAVAKPINDNAGVPGIVAVADRVLRAWRSEAPPALNDGGLGVAPVRSLAKKLGVPAVQVGVIANHLVRREILRPEVARIEGRGRNRAPVYRWGVASDDGWESRSAVHQWADLVAWWLEADLAERRGTPERVARESPDPDAVLARSLFVRFLLGVDTGTGLDAEDLAIGLWWRFPAVFGPNHVDALVAVARALGIVPSAGPVGITSAARALLAGRVGEIVADDERNFVVQNDHTIVAPTNLSRDLASSLAVIADLESEGGARVFRLTEASIARGLEHGFDGPGLEAFLCDNASKPVPQAVVYLVHDVARKRNRLSIAEGATVIVSDDPALVAQAVKVTAARLRAVGLHAAVSPLAAAKVEVALRAKGVLGVRLLAESDTAKPSATTTDRTRPASSGTSGAGSKASSGAGGAPDQLDALRKAAAVVGDTRTLALARTFRA